MALSDSIAARNYVHFLKRYHLEHDQSKNVEYSTNIYKLLTDNDKKNIENLIHIIKAKAQEALPDSVFKGLEQINAIATASSHPLYLQNDECQELVMNELRRCKNAKENQETVINYEAIEKFMNDGTIKEIHEKNEAQVSPFVSKPLHDSSRGQKEWLQDHDITRLMPHPKNNFSILVLGSLNLANNETTGLLVNAIIDALSNPGIKHIMFPVGPGHWRGVYISKPQKPEEKYTLELFDSFGPNSASVIEKNITSLLQSAGIAIDKLIIKKIAPHQCQEDGYACGDFVCAYSSQKMEEWRAEPTEYHQVLIDALTQGNQNGSLRKASQELTKTICGMLNTGVSSPAANSLKNEAPSSSKPVTDRLSREDLALYNKVIGLFSSKVRNGDKAKYEETIGSLISRKEIITGIANKTLDNDSTPLERDENLAAKLQIEEFEQELEKGKDPSSITKGP